MMRSTSYGILVLILCALGIGLYLFAFAGEITTREIVATQQRVLGQVSETIDKAQPVLDGALGRVEAILPQVEALTHDYQRVLGESGEAIQELGQLLAVTRLSVEEQNERLGPLLDAVIKREEARADALAQAVAVLADIHPRIETTLKQLSALATLEGATAEQAEALRTELASLLGLARTGIDEMLAVLNELRAEDESPGREILEEILGRDVPDQLIQTLEIVKIAARDLGELSWELGSNLKATREGAGAWSLVANEARTLLTKVDRTLEEYVQGMQGAGDAPSGDRALGVVVSTLGTRVGSVLILVFVVQILVGFYRYSTRMASQHDGIADTLEIVAETGFDNLATLTALFSSSTIDFGKMSADSSKSMMAALQSLAERKG
ncbi:MAG: hypothetical protein V3T84_04685 [Phycisphaerales bacterium]